MNARFLRLAGFSLALSAMLFLGACQKKSASAKLPKTPPPPTQSSAAASATPAPVVQPKATAPAPASTPSLSAAELFQRNVKDIYFDYDRYDIRAADTATLQADANFLDAHASDKITIAGHCDDRGSEVYNMALGASRANSVRNQLKRLGIATDRIQTVSYGKEKPFCTQDTQDCWQLNRRAHFMLNQ
jgi:peptidoglycan-associated lipoprotein